MYCKKCGTNVQNDDNFCPGCGLPVEPLAPVAETGVPVLKLRPVFVPWAVWITTLPLQAFMTIWGGGFFGGVSLFAAQALGLDIPAWSPFAFFAILFFVGIPFVAYAAQKSTYTKTEYTFYATRLDYYEGFFTTQQKTIEYKNVTEVILTRGVIQKRCGLGTITLSTPATGSIHGRARSGIQIADVPNAEQVYTQIKALVSRAAAGARAA